MASRSALDDVARAQAETGQGGILAAQPTRDPLVGPSGDEEPKIAVVVVPLFFLFFLLAISVLIFLIARYSSIVGQFVISWWRESVGMPGGQGA